MNTNPIRLLAAPFVALLCLFTCGTAKAVGPNPVRTVAVTGQAVPGLPAGVNWQSFAETNLTNAGQVAFRAKISGTGVAAANDSGIWSEGLGPLGLVVREGQLFPGSSTEAYSELFMPTGIRSLQISTSGETFFLGLKSTNGIQNGFVVARGGASLQNIFQEPAPAAGFPVGTTIVRSFVSHENNFFNSNGAYLTTFAYQGSGFLAYNNIFLGTNVSGSLQTILREGSASPGFPGTLIQQFPPAQFYNDLDPTTFKNTTLTDNGRVVFSSFITRRQQVAVSGAYEQVLWSDRNGSLQAVAVTGDYEPSVPGYLHDAFRESLMNEAGQIAFSSSQRLADGQPFFNNLTLWRNDAGTNRLILQNGTAAPGMASGVTFSSSTMLYALSDSGKLAIRVNVNGTGITTANNSGIWSEQNGVLVNEYQEGTPVPGIAAVLFGELSAPLVNDAGSLAFFSNLTGTGVTSANNAAIWAEDTQGLLNLIARTGSSLEVLPGDLRTISALSLEGFNDAGQVLYRANFTNGTSGLFLSDLVVVPEPSTYVLTAGAAFSMLWFRRRKSKTGIRPEQQEII